MRALLFGLLFASLLRAAPAPSYRVVAHYPLDASVRCAAVALDAAGRRLYAAQGDRIEILDADTGAKRGAIAATPGVRAFALVPALGRGFAAEGTANQVAAFDLATGAVAWTAPSGGREPAALWYDPEVRRLFVANRVSGDLGAIDPASGQSGAVIPLGGKLGGVVGNGYGTLFVAAEDRNVLHVVDTHAMAAEGDDPVAPGVGPFGLAMDPAGRRVFVSCANGRMPIVDADAGFVFQVLPIGSGRAQVVFDKSKQPNPDGGPPWKARILTASDGGILSALRMDAFIHYSFHDDTAIPSGARGLAFDPKTGRAFVALPHEILVLGR